MRNLLLITLAAGLAGCPPTKGDDSDSGTTNPPTDLDGDGFSADVDCNDSDGNINPGAEEVCDGVDNNCDEVVDDTTVGGGTYYADADGDSYGDPTKSTVACAAPTGSVSDNTDCNDGNKDIHPGAAEVCDANNLDEDCDGKVNDADPDATGGGVYYADNDQDTFGDPNNSKTACSAPAGYVNEPVDCDDSNANAHPGASEVCDGADNDCNGKTDDEDAGVSGKSTFYADNDGDTYGDGNTVAEACAAPSGFTADNTDCDDSDASNYPGNAEVCDSQDNDCDQLVDDSDPDVLDSPWYMDLDGDGYGDASMVMYACTMPSGAVADNTDCDDTQMTVNPAASEICDAANTDENCDGAADDADLSVSGTFTFYQDADGDGYGDASITYDLCDALANMSEDATDCDDADASVGGPTEWYIDSDNDGYGDASTSILQCTQPSGYVSNTDDPFESYSLTAFSATATIQEATDVSVHANAIYVVGFNGSDVPAVFSVDPANGAVTELYSGDPLVQPTGIAVSVDGSTLYLTDAGSEDGGSGLSGAVYSMSASGGSLATEALTGIVDMPTDVVVTPDGKSIFVAAKLNTGEGAVFEQKGSTLTAYTWPGTLSEPMALAVTADGNTIYVLDARTDGGGAILSFPTAFNQVPTVIATNPRIAFPGGLAVSEDGARVFYAGVGPATLHAIDPNGLFSESIPLSGAVLPAGLSITGETLSIVDLSADATADLYTLSY